MARPKKADAPKTAKERLIRLAQTRIKNKTIKLTKLKGAYEATVQKIVEEMAEQREILKALGVRKLT